MRKRTKRSKLAKLVARYQTNWYGVPESWKLKIWCPTTAAQVGPYNAE